MSRALVVVLLLALQVGSGIGCRPRERPSAILVTIDTLRPDRLSVYGYGRPTPRLDAFAREGALFEHALCDVPWTSASMASVFTGRYATHHGIRLGTDRLPDAAVTLAEVLRDHGWRTAAVIGSFPLASVYNLSQGFESYDEHLDTPMLPFIPNMKPKFDVKHVPPVDLADASTFGPYFAEKVFSDAFRTDDAVTNAAMRWLDAHHEAPFFLWVHYFGPHERILPAETSEAASTRIVGEYDRDLAFTDAHVGRLFDHVDALGLRDRALVVLHSDHGQSLGENGYVGHGDNLYQASLRIPLMMRWPGRIPANLRVRGWVENVDIFPTMLRALGVSTSLPLDGFDLLEFLQHSPPGLQQVGFRRPAYSETYFPVIAPHSIAVPELGTISARPVHRGLLHRNRMYVTTHLLPPCSDEGGASIADDACRALRLETLFDPLADPQGRHDLREADTSTLARLRAALGPYTAAATIGAESAPLDDAAKRKLRALGYVW